MTITDAAEQTGLTPFAIRFYEKAGVFPAPERRGGVRRFSALDLARLRWIASARRAGIALGRIHATIDRAGCIRERGATLVRRIIALEQRRRELAAELAAVDRVLAETRCEFDAVISSLPTRVVVQ